MSKLFSKQNKPVNAVTGAIQGLKSHLKNTGALVPKASMEGMFSLGTLGDAELADVSTAADTAKSVLFDIMGQAGLSTESLTPAQIEAGVLPLMAYEAPGRYHQRASKVNSGDALPDGMVLVSFSNESLNGGYDYRTELRQSLEAFDETELKNTLAFSAITNVQAARQDDYCETFYPTMVISPDQAGLDIVIRRSMVMRETRHNVNGSRYELNRRSLIEAARDFTILQDESTKVVPAYIPGDTINNSKFANVAKLVPWQVITNGVGHLTSGFKPGEDVDIIGIGQNAGVTRNGQLDQKESLSAQMNLENVWFRIVNQGGTESIVKFETKHMSRSQFQKTPGDGFAREMLLNFITVDLPIHGFTKDIAGVDAGALSYLRDPLRENWVVRLKVSINGTADTETGNMTVQPAMAKIDTVYEVPQDGSPAQQIIDPALLAALNAQLPTIEFFAWTPLAFRTNLIRKEQGLLINQLEYGERYLIPLGPPVTLETPVTDTNTGADMTGPITAIRTRNSNNAITKLLDYAVTLRDFVQSISARVPAPAIEGIGRLLIDPFYEHHVIDLTEQVQNLKSHERNADIQATIVNAIRLPLYRGYRDSNYQAALDALTGGAGERPQVIVGTDNIIEQYIFTPGDTRTLALGFENKVVTSVDRRVYDKIFVTLSRPSQQTEPDPLSFGIFAWVPELATSLQVTQNGATYKQIMMQTRARHINMLPWLIEFDVVGLPQVTADRIPVPFEMIV